MNKVSIATIYFRLSGWRYIIPNILSNKNYCYMLQLNYFYMLNNLISVDSSSIRHNHLPFQVHTKCLKQTDSHQNISEDVGTGSETRRR